MTIATILAGRPNDIVRAGIDDRVSDLVSVLAARRIGAVPVLEGEAVVGIFSERDVIHGLAAQGGVMLDRRVGDVMTTPAITVQPDESVLGALALMTRRRIRHLPVVDGTRLVGFVSIGDLVKYRIDRIEADADAMRSYIQSA